MGKTVGFVLAGGLLIAAFLTWMLLKGTDAVQAWLEPNPVLGFLVWGVAVLCGFAGAALIARVVFRGGPRTTDEAR
ncbi:MULTISPECIES: hypothetical protein [Microbacterium]|uniref:hypothetical protein n=1 Tax=Microbacterium TaxID=33882 RepID=UPI000AA92408|nr:hypothetical protein [Microbacterium testaceum]